MHKLAPGIYAETTFKGVNVGAVVTSDGIVCIDTPTHPADCRKWRLKLAQFGGQPIRFVVNTDHHRDRTRGNQWFEAPVIAHELTGERMRAMPETYRVDPEEIADDFELAGELNGVRLVPPQVTFAQEAVLAKGGQEIHLLHRPGSAPGAVWVHLPEHKILFTGDSIVVDTVPLFGEANIEQWLENLAAIRKPRFPADVIVPGRGRLTDKSAVKDMMTFLRTARRKIDRLAARRGPADGAALIPEMLDQFSLSAAEREQAARRLKAGIDRMIAEARGQAAS
jgi:cyclase